MGEHPLVPPAIGVLMVMLALAACGFAILRLKQRAIRRAWAEAAEALGGKLQVPPGKRTMVVHGAYRGYNAFLGEGVSFEDAAPYYHTRGALSIRNPAHVVLGLRHKSLLEEFLTRNELNAVPTGDPSFDRAFYLVVSTPEHVRLLIPESIRRVLARWNDVEVYVNGPQIAWRRASTVRSVKEMMALFEVIAGMADVLGNLPPRDLTPEQKHEEEKLIEHGV